MASNRSAPRKSVGLLVKLGYLGVDEFAEKYATNLSDGGMFVRTREPAPVGTEVRFKVEIAGGQRVLQGIAVVRWIRAEAPSGMGLQFVKLDAASQVLVERMLRGRKDASPPKVEPVLPPASKPPSPVAAAEPPPQEIDLDLDALVAETQPPTSSMNFEPKADLAPPLEPEVVVPLEPDVTATTLPEIRRDGGRASGAPMPVPTIEVPASAPPETRPRPAGPVFLKEVAPQNATGPIIGIDLGTTNSAVAVLTKGRPVILNSKDGYNTLPSVVALTAQNKLLVGHRAKQQLVLNPTRSIFGAKRLVGRDYDSPTVRQVRERFHYEICADDQGRAAVRLGESILSLEEVQGLVLRECRELAEQSLGQKVHRAVVTCPAYYSEAQREAVRRAGRLAGLQVERVLNEPTAAALAFGMNRDVSKRVLVYDLGGGTFDATLLRLDKNVFEVLATGGDVFLGGVDFDNQIVDLLLERFQQQHGQPFSGDRVALSRIAEVAERAKTSLSERSQFEVHLPMLEMDAAGVPRDLRCTLQRADVEKACADLVDRTIQAVQDVLLDAKLKADQVDDVVLVGGMSRMPLVRERLKEVFKKTPLASVNADEAVALGAALYTGSVDKVSSLVLIDVVPMTIGLGKPGGGFHRLIERNTPLPATRSFGLSTHLDDQPFLEVMIFQGEDSNVAGNEFVGALRVEGLPRGPKGSVQVAITLSLDAECVLKVEAREFRTNKVVQATLATRYTSDQIAKKLGISDAQRVKSQEGRAAELEKRAGGFWSRLKKVFGRAK